MAVVSFIATLSTQAAAAPSLRDVLDVPQPSQPKLSPNKATVAFTVEQADWTANRYDKEVFVARKDAPPTQITHNKAGSSYAARWAPDGRALAYIADEADGAPQLYVCDPDGAHARRLTALPAGVMSFEWAPDGAHVAALSFDVPDAPSNRTSTYGDFTILHEEKPRASLWLVDVAPARPDGTGSARRLTGTGETKGVSIVAFSVADLVSNYAFSPDSRRLVFTYAASLNILDAIKADVAILDLESGHVRRLPSTPDYWDESPVFSPDGRQVLFTRTNLKDFLADNELMIAPADNGEAKPLVARRKSNGASLGQTLLLGWRADGVYVFTLEGVDQSLQRIDPRTGLSAMVRGLPPMTLEADISGDGRAMTALGLSPGGVPEVYRAKVGHGAPTRVSETSRAVEAWPQHKVEMVAWKAPDGVPVEGVLYTPQDAKGPLPLVVVLHGGPREVARPTRLHNELFPVEYWLDQGAAVLYPNYRSSVGYGETFRRLSTLNTGNAEALDINSGVDHLVSQGLVDPKRVAVVGHSWGGYLSAFLATSTDRYRAAVVASGITDNTANYVMANAGVSELGYLKSSPWTNPQRWAATSPITYVAKAKTPTLIQHGASDPVVPVINAYMLDKGLTDMGVPVRTVIYGDTEHNGFRPKERLSANMQNAQWISHYLLGVEEPLPWDAPR